MIGHLWSVLVGSGVFGAIVAAFGWLYRRYRRSAVRELQPFWSYVTSSIRLAVTRRLRPVLARRFGVRPYAEGTLAGLSTKLPVPSRGRRHIELDKAYIRLSLSSAPRQHVDDTSLLSARGSVLIFGEPGSGKSSLTRKLHRDALKTAYLSPFRSRLPLRVELGRLRWDFCPDDLTEATAWFELELRSLVTRVKRVNDAGFVFQAFADGPGLIVFLDGLDEVPSTRAKLIHSVITGTVEAFRLRSPETLLVVTARTQLSSTLGRAFLDGFGQVLTVTPFTQADIFAFLRRWDFPAERRLIETHRIFDRLRNNATLSAMCTNPLVLAMYVAEDEAQSNDADAVTRLADTRAKFYDQVAGELLYFRRQDQRSTEDPAGTQLLVTRQELLGRIALDHLLHSESPANVVSLGRAADIAKRYWDAEARHDAEQKLTLLAVDTGLVTVQQEGESLCFIHLSICEYLAGKELAERDEKQLLRMLDRITTDEERRLWETAIFAVALSKRSTRERALQRLTEQQAPAELVMRICQETKTYDSPEFAAALTSATAQLSATPVAQWDSAWLAQVRLILACLGDAQRLSTVRRNLDLPSVETFFHDLVQADARRMDGIFDIYLADSPGEALRLANDLAFSDALFAEPARIVSAMESPDLIALSMRIIATGKTDIAPWADALAEASLHHELVAQMLFEEKEIPPTLQDAIRNVPPRHAWHRSGPAENTFLGGVLAMATAHASGQRTESTDAGRVDILSRVKPKDRDVKNGQKESLKNKFVWPGSIASSLPLSYFLIFNNEAGENLVTFIIWPIFGSIIFGFFLRFYVNCQHPHHEIDTGTVRQLLNLASRDHGWHDYPGAIITKDGSINRIYTPIGGNVDAHDLAAWIGTITIHALSGKRRINSPDGIALSTVKGARIADLRTYSPVLQALSLFQSAERMTSAPISVRNRLTLLPIRSEEGGDIGSLPSPPAQRATEDDSRRSVDR